MTPFLISRWAGLALAVSLAAPASAAVPLAAHHAVYKLSLLRSTGTKAPESVDGLLTYDFSGSACDGYAITLRQLTALQPQEGDSHVSEMSTASFEDANAQDYRFKVDSKEQADGKEQVDGSAHKADGGAVAVALKEPKAESVTLDKGVLFPTEHLRKVLDTAEAGGKVLSAQVFDGSDTGKKVFNTLTVIGAVKQGTAPGQAAQLDPLRNMRRWPVSISYFDAAKPDDPPEYVLSFDLYENGIAGTLKLDYGDFVLSGDLTELKLLPASACAK